MKVRFDPALTSTLLISLCLLTFIPGSLNLASTWRQRYFNAGDLKEQNLLMPLGFYALGFVMIGLTVLWTGYRKKERWAWFVMLGILLFFVFPANVFPLFLQVVQEPEAFKGVNFFQSIREGYRPAIWLAVGVLTSLVMSVALILPVKAFFWGRPAPQDEDDLQR
jgi:cell division protein FtsW (lipid II flippase)